MTQNELQEMAKSSFLHDIQELTRAYESIQWSAFEQAAIIISDAEHIITIGVGKSAIMAKRLASSLTSIGVKSMFVHPIDALHGDIGIIGSNDTIVMFSNSGNTEEIVSIMPFLKLRTKNVIGVIGNRESILAKQCTICIDARIDREGCPLQIVPTTSLLMATAISNALIVTVMHQLGVNKDDFARSHPAGQLGRNLLLNVESVMIKGSSALPFVHSEMNLKDIIIIMSEKRLGCAIVIDEYQQMIGFITDGDVRRCLSRIDNITETRAKDIMSVQPISVRSEASLGEALSLMEDREHKIGVLPVINEANHCIGIIRLHDIAGHIR
jgi:arabinose-5-phosphate isomerase